MTGLFTWPRVVAVMAIVAALGLVGRGVFDAGVRSEKAAEAKRVAAAEKVVAKVAKGGVAIAADVGRQLESTKVEIRYRTQFLKEEVPVYVPFEVDRGFIVPDGFVRLHDAAAEGRTLPAVPGGSVEAPSGVALSAVADTVVDNYGACHILAAEVTAWRDWYPREAALWNSNIKAMSPSP